MTETSESIEENKDNKIDLLEVVRKILAGRKTIIKTMIVFFIIGVLMIIFSPKEYKSEITLVVETNSNGSSKSSLLQQFGGLTGISLDKNDKEALSPDLYPEVIKTKPFLLELMNQKVVESKYDSTITIAQYFERYTHSSFVGIIKKYTIGLPGKIIKWIRGEKNTTSELNYSFSENDSLADSIFHPIKLSQKQTDITEALSGCISTQQDFKKSNKFIISVEMQDPLVVAQATSYVVKNLTKYIIEYRTKKSKTDLKFVSACTAEAETKYLDAQQALATYKDRNKNVILSSVLAKEEQLQSEYDLAFDLYSTLAKQLEQARIKVQQETPVFNVMDPAQIPLQKSKPRTIITLITMILIGLIAGAGIIFGKMYLIKIKNIFQ